MRRKAEGVGRATAVIFESKLGWGGVASTGRGLTRVVLPKKDKNAVERALIRSGCGARGSEPAAARHLSKAVVLLANYFAGERVSFDLPLDLRSYTPFQRAVWNAAAGISYGEIRSYGWIAKRMKNPRAARAVGQALGANPVPVIIPCHRVIASSGLGGYSGGLGMKRKLLTLENKIINHREHGEKRT